MLVLLSAIWKFLGWVFLPIKRNGCFFAFMFALGALCIFYEVPARHRPYVFGWQELFLDLYVVCAVLAIFPKVIRRILRFIISAVMYVTTIADVFCFIKFKTYFNPSILQLIRETTKQETQEFINSYLSLDLFNSLLGQVLIILAAHIIWGSIMSSVEEKKKGKRSMGLTIVGEKLEAIGKVVNPILGLGTLGVLILALWNTTDNKKLMAELMTHKTVGEVETKLTQKEQANLYIPIYRVLFSFYTNQLAFEQISTLREAQREVKVDTCTFKSRNIILIIGESYNKRHSQLYGYDKKTTPRQTALYDTGYLVTFTDAITPWNLTSYVFKNFFSMHTTSDEGEWSDCALFPELYKKAGYHVTFLTNQFLPKARDAVYDFSGGFFLNDTVLSRNLFDTRNEKTHQYDEGLLADYDSLKKFNTDAQLTIIHLMGQHVDYRKRYPANRQFYHKEDYNRPKLDDKEKTILAHYDNATRYNDSIVACIVTRVYNDDAIVIYIPDHGEEVFGDDVHAYGRIHSDVTPRLAKEELEIPMWIWCSEKYAKAHPDIFKKLWLNRKKPLMTDAFAHTMLSIAGIETPEYKPEYDILSDKYNEKRPRIVKGKWDYDKLMAQPEK